MFAVLGSPIEHTGSPALHNAAFRAAGLDAVYVALSPSEGNVGHVIRALGESGGGGNVTLPYKQVALAAVDDLTEAATATGALNTFWAEDGRIAGDNTDVVGFLRAWEGLIGSDPHGATVLVLGAGGAGRAVIHGLLSQGADRVFIWNRTAAKAEELQTHYGDVRLQVVPTVDSVLTEGVDALVNATSVGLHGEPPPVSLEQAPRAPGAVLDLVYGPEGTPLVRLAREMGIPAADGTDMLVGQAAAAFERWWNIPAPVAAMRQSLVSSWGTEEG